MKVSTVPKDDTKRTVPLTRAACDEPKPFLDHIEDLRIMLIKMLVVLGLMMGAAFAFQKTVVEIMSALSLPSILIGPVSKISEWLIRSP
jgi:Sec-independent protein secretion pathway component TatC